jgi:hypothetical protein
MFNPDIYEIKPFKLEFTLPSKVDKNVFKNLTNKYQTLDNKNIE